MARQSRTWPPIDAPELRSRLALDLEGFRAALHAFAAAVGRREVSDAQVARALGYPWDRPERSYVLRCGEVEELGDGTGLSAWTAGRHPVLAFGSNAAPSTLRLKFGHFPDARDRDTLVLAGELHDFDVGPMATVTAYGAMPATLFASPGTAVRAWVLWLTRAQVTQLTWSELHYGFGRLDGARFAADEHEVLVDEVFAYVARVGTFAPGGAPVALAALPARGRVAPAVTQEEALALAAPLVLGPGASAQDLVRAVFADWSAVVARAEERLWPHGIVLRADAWTPYPTAVR